MRIPPDFLTFAARGDDWRAWMDDLPRLARDVLAQWRLRVDGEVATGECAIVIPVRTTDDEPAELKLGYPQWEADHEHLALRAWSGDGAVRLLRADPNRYALLLERAHRRDLTTVPVLEACTVVAERYSRLHITALPQLRLLSEQCAIWSEGLAALPAHRLVPRRYVDQAASLARGFATDPMTDGRLLHTDLHYFNVLASEREPWLVIDPKPLSGDPHFEVAPLLWNRWDEVVESGDVRRAVRARLHTVVDTALLDERRASAWVTVRMMVNVLWTFEDLQRESGAAGEMSEDDRGWITMAVSIVKAVQE